MKTIVQWTLRYPKSVLFLGLLLTLFSVYLSRSIKIRSNFSDLLPDTHPAVVQARELEKTVGGASFIVVAAETKNPQAAMRFLDDFRNKLLERRPEGIRYIDDRPPTDFLKKSSLLYLSLEDLNQLHQDIQRKIETGKLKKTRLYIDLEEDVGGYSDDLDTMRGKYSTFLNPTPYYQNKEGTLFASLIKPNWRTTDVARTQEFVDKLNTLLKELAPEKYDASLQIKLTGPYIKPLTQKKILLKDAGLISSISFLGAIAYLVFHFRRKRAVFLIGVPLTVSTIWALGLAYLMFGSLNLFSSVFCAILLGIGADFGIHIYSEYHGYRKTGFSPKKALITSIGNLGRAFVAASSTTIAAFLSLAFTRFKALHEMGIIAGVGIAACGVAFLLLFPPLTLLMEKWRPEKIKVDDWSEKTQKFSHSWMTWVFSRKNLALSTLLITLPVLALFFGHLKFDYNLNHILGQQETKELDQNIDGIFNHSVNPEVALAKNYSDAALVARSIRDVQEKNKNLPGGTTIKGVLSLADFIPDNQTEKIEKISKIEKLFSPMIVKAMGDQEKKSYDEFKLLLHPHPIALENLPEQITNKFQDREGSVGRMIFIFPNFEMTQADRFMRFVEEVREVQCPSCEAPFYASGESTVYYEIVKLLSHEGRYVMGFTIAAILLSLLVNFRSLKATLTVFSPLMVGLLGLFGWMSVLGVPFNIINIAAIPIILGTADDYSVHFFQRYKDNPTSSLNETYRHTFRPILGSAITTFIGFGSLALANMGGIRSFGLVCSIGIFLCTCTTLVWFPAFLSLLKKPFKKEGLAS